MIAFVAVDAEVLWTYDFALAPTGTNVHFIKIV